MRKRLFILFLLLFAVLFLACQSDDDNDVGNEELEGKYWCYTGILSDEYSDTLEYHSSYESILDNYYGALFWVFNSSAMTIYAQDDIEGTNHSVYYDDSLVTI